MSNAHTVAQLLRWVRAQYGTEPDHPWERFPDYTVLRHAATRKWYALLMKVPAARLGLAGDSELAIVNLKCDPLLLEPLLSKPGFLPAYHMNRRTWVTVMLDGSVAMDELKFLLDRSYRLTDGGRVLKVRTKAQRTANGASSTKTPRQ